MELSVQIDEGRPPYHVVSVTGELDVYTAPQLREALAQVANDGHRQIVVDLDGLDFLDSSGVGVLVAAHEELRSDDGDLTLICTRPKVFRIFEITGLTSFFTIVNSVDEATVRQTG